MRRDRERAEIGTGGSVTSRFTYDSTTVGAAADAADAAHANSAATEQGELLHVSTSWSVSTINGL